MADEIAAARANLKKASVDISKPMPSANDLFVAKPVAVKAGDVRGESRLTDNGLNRVAVDKNAVADEHDFSNLRAGLKKTGSAPAIKAVEPAPVKDCKIVSNGIDRTAVDKNAVNDDFDFASLRAGLKKPGAEKVPDKKVEEAKKKTPGAAGEVKISNQMFVAKKPVAEPVADVRNDKDRLKNNGMDRDRVDKNAVGDEHNFANLRANLKKTGQ